MKNPIFILFLLFPSNLIFAQSEDFTLFRETLESMYQQEAAAVQEKMARVQEARNTLENQSTFSMEIPNDPESRKEVTEKEADQKNKEPEVAVMPAPAPPAKEKKPSKKSLEKEIADTEGEELSREKAIEEYRSAQEVLQEAERNLYRVGVLESMMDNIVLEGQYLAFAQSLSEENNFDLRQKLRGVLEMNKERQSAAAVGVINEILDLVLSQ